MKVEATIDTIAAARSEEKDQAAREDEEKSQARKIDAEAETYTEARDALFKQIPKGWMIVGGIGVLPHRADTYRRPR